MSIDGKTLTEGTDYKVAYSNNVEVGTATASVIGMGDYAADALAPDAKQDKNFTITSTVLLVEKKTQRYTVFKGIPAYLALPESDLSIVKCTSGRKKVATVTNDGVVTAKAAGKVTITVKMSNKKTRRVILTVVDPTQVTKISFDNKTETLKVGESLQLKPNIEPTTYESELTWKVGSNKAVMVYDDGKVTALKPGTATVTVIPKNRAKGGVKASIKIKVTE